MKKEYKIILLTAVFIILLMIALFLTIGKYGIGQIIDKWGITHDVYEVKVDKEFWKHTYIYWYGGSNNVPKDNRMLFYYLSKQADIPPFYGDNGFEIKYKETTYDKIRFWKMFSYSKYNYYINIKPFNNNMIVEWHISNWYDPEIYQGRDTIKLDNK